MMARAAETMTLAPEAVVRRIWEKNPDVFRIVRQSAQAPAGGLVALLPLNARGAEAIATGRFEGARPDPELIAGLGENSACALFLADLRARQARQHARGDRSAPARIRGRGMRDLLAGGRCAVGPAPSDHRLSRRPGVFPGRARMAAGHLPGARPATASRTRKIEVRLVRSFEDMAKVFSVRSSTYLAEQFCLYDEEFDGNDFCASQFLGTVDGDPAGCIRLRYFGGFAKLERLAVRKEYRRTPLAFELVRASLRHSRRKNFTHVYGHCRRDLLPFWGRFGFRPIEDRPVFRFANLDYVEVAANLEEDPEAIRFGGDPMVAIRPEGAWDRPGPLDLSNLSNDEERVALIRSHTRMLGAGMTWRPAFSAADARQLQRTIEALTKTVDLLRSRLAEPRAGDAGGRRAAGRSRAGGPDRDLQSRLAVQLLRSRLLLRSGMGHAPRSVPAAVPRAARVRQQPVHRILRAVVDRASLDPGAGGGRPGGAVPGSDRRPASLRPPDRGRPRQDRRLSGGDELPELRDHAGKPARCLTHRRSRPAAACEAVLRRIGETTVARDLAQAMADEGLTSEGRALCRTLRPKFVSDSDYRRLVAEGGSRSICSDAPSGGSAPTPRCASSLFGSHPYAPLIEAHLDHDIESVGRLDALVDAGGRFRFIEYNAGLCGGAFCSEGVAEIFLDFARDGAAPGSLFASLRRPARPLSADPRRGFPPRPAASAAKPGGHPAARRGGASLRGECGAEGARRLCRAKRSRRPLHRARGHGRGRERSATTTGEIDIAIVVDWATTLAACPPHHLLWQGRARSGTWIANSLGASVLRSGKHLLAVLSDPACGLPLRADERAWVDAHIPWSRLLARARPRRARGRPGRLGARESALAGAEALLFDGRARRGAGLGVRPGARGSWPWIGRCSRPPSSRSASSPRRKSIRSRPRPASGGARSPAMSASIPGRAPRSAASIAGFPRPACSI